MTDFPINNKLNLGLTQCVYFVFHWFLPSSSRVLNVSQTTANLLFAVAERRTTATLCVQDMRSQ